MARPALFPKDRGVLGIQVDDYKTEFNAAKAAKRKIYQHFSMGDWALRAVVCCYLRDR